MEGYLGETELKISESEYKDFTATDWVMLWIEKYGWIDGAHHKTWLIDQIARICKGTPVKLSIASWENGYSEPRLKLGDPSEKYNEWVKEMKKGEDGPDSYEYDCGIAP